MPKGDRTLEDVVRELLRPLLQQWLDDNLPAIVQQSVEAEVERIARSRVR
jgi:cell pole-organizing protein PopZ